MKNKNSRLQELMDLALQHGLISENKKKSDFAKLIGRDPSTLSHAIADDGKVSMDNIIKSAELALLRNGISINASGDGSMQNVTGSNNSVGVPAKNFTHEDEWFALVAEKDKQIDRLLTIIENLRK